MKAQKVSDRWESHKVGSTKRARKFVSVTRMLINVLWLTEQPIIVVNKILNVFISNVLHDTSNRTQLGAAQLRRHQKWMIHTRLFQQCIRIGILNNTRNTKSHLRVSWVRREQDVEEFNCDGAFCAKTKWTEQEKPVSCHARSLSVETGLLRLIEA